MTNATASIFVDELKKCNPEKADLIRLGRGFDLVIYSGRDPRELIAPEPFAWDEENNGFSDLAAIRAEGMVPLFQLFRVETE